MLDKCPENYYYVNIGCYFENVSGIVEALNTNDAVFRFIQYIVETNRFHERPPYTDLPYIIWDLDKTDLENIEHYFYNLMSGTYDHIVWNAIPVINDKGNFYVVEGRVNSKC